MTGILAALCAAGWSACAGPTENEEPGIKDIGALLAGGEPVKGTQVEGSVPLATDPFALAEPQEIAAEIKPPAPQAEVAPVHQNPYIRFGERIIVRTGVGGVSFITKPYTMPSSKAKRLVDLMGALEPFPFRTRPAVDPATGQAPPLDPGLLEYQILDNWDEEFYSNLKTPFDASVPDAPKAVASDPVSERKRLGRRRTRTRAAGL